MSDLPTTLDDTEESATTKALMQVWLQSKLDHITKEFLNGGGYGAVFEASYLAYLECLLAPRGVDLWGLWKDVCKEATPKGEQVQCLSNRVTDREELVKALLKFRGRFEGPTPHSWVALSEDPPKHSPEHSPDIDAGWSDLFDLLTEDRP